MSCRVGHAGWLSTDANACYATSSGRLRQCVCPLTTCVRNSSNGSSSCQLTTPVLVLSGCALAVWLLAAAAYVYLANMVDAMEQEAHHASDVQLGRNYFYTKLFGNDDDDDDDDDNNDKNNNNNDTNEKRVNDTTKTSDGGGAADKRTRV